MNNVILYNNFIHKKYRLFGYIFLVNANTYRYSWSTSKSPLIQYFFINTTSNLKKRISLKKTYNLDRINSIIIFKKKSSIFKKVFDYEYTILNKSIFDKNKYFKKNDNLNLIKPNYLPNKFNFQTKQKFNTKIIDFKRKFTVLLKKNRVILRKFLKVKFKRQFVFNKFIRNLSKLNSTDFLYKFEFRIHSILVRSNFFYNNNDCLWFFNNGLVSLNGSLIYDFNKKLKPLEIVTISINDYYYFFYRKNLNDCLNNSYRYNKKIWKINKQRYEGDSKREERYPTWIYKYMYFKNDVPKFIEVDYISMSLVVLNYSIKSNYFDFYNLKFLNLYTNRLYNWKYII